MAWKPPPLLLRLWHAAKIVWAITILIVATAFGAHTGWQSHGLVGALAVGFIGMAAGVFLTAAPTLVIRAALSILQ